MTEDVKPEKFDLSSLNIAAEKRASLLRLFPEARTEGGDIDFTRLQIALGNKVDVGRERFGLVWPGKADCFKTIQTASSATLVPAEDLSEAYEKTENVFIEGDNLEVLKLLQKPYLGKVKLIYIDPPYNTGSDLIYPDNFSESLQTYLIYTGQADSGGRKFGTNTEADGRFHSNWLNMMFPRLYLARNLLREDGVIAISIGEGELQNLLRICDEIFGEENRITVCSRVMKTGGQKGLYFSPCVDYVAIYARNVDELDPFRAEIGQNVIDKVYTKVAKDGARKGERYRQMGLYQAMLDARANQRYFIECPDGELVIPPGDSMPELAAEGEQCAPLDGDGVWRWTYARYKKEKEAGNIEFVRSEKTSLITKGGNQGAWNVYYKIWLNDRLEQGQLPGNILDKFESRHSSAELKALEIPFDFAKPTALIKFLMSVCGVKDGDITLDFFAGSGSTGHAAMAVALELDESRPFICVQIPEQTADDSEEAKAGFKTISAIAMERLRRAGKQLSELHATRQGDVGFRVFKLAESNLLPWDADASSQETALKKQLELHVNHIREGRRDKDILVELLLKSGFPLTTYVEEKIVAGKKVFSVGGDVLLICLERKLTLELIRAMADLKPERVVCLDEGFASNDQLKANAVQTFRTKGVASFRTV